MLGQGSRDQLKAGEGSQDRSQEGGSNATTENNKRPTSPSPSVDDTDFDLEIFARAGFDYASMLSCALALIWAARRGLVPMVQRLLDTKKTPVETGDTKGLTALHWSAKTANFELFQLLLSRGADHHAVTDRGSTALHIACSFSSKYATTFPDDHNGSYEDRRAICQEL